MEWFLRIWVPIAIAVTGMCAVSFGTVQQLYRQSLNDPQIEMSEYIGGMLEDRSSQSAEETIHIALSDLGMSNSKINVEMLAPVVAYFDTDGKYVAGTALYLNGDLPAPPKGVFEYTRANLSDRLTWEPSPNYGLRLATVVRYVGGLSPGFLVVARNMREVEDREENLQNQVLIAWLVTLLATLVTAIAADWYARRA